MIEKIKNLFAKMPHGIIPFVVVIALLGVCILIGLLSNSQEPIELSDDDDKDTILNMLKEQHGDKEIVNLELVKNVVYEDYKDSIVKLLDNVETVNDIVLHTDAVTYTVIQNDSVKENWTTIFEVEEKSSKEQVGQHLITFKR